MHNPAALCMQFAGAILRLKRYVYEATTSLDRNNEVEGFTTSTKNES